MAAKIKGIIYIDGKIFPIEKAQVPVMDHGFLYGDSIYETFRTVGGYPLQLNGHLKRLERSAKAIELKIPYSSDRLCKETLRTARAYWKTFGKKRSFAQSAQDDKDDIYLRIIISRGYGDIGFDPKLCPKPRVIIIAKQYHPSPKTQYEQGITVALVPIIRNAPEAINPNIKSGNYLNNLLAYIEAKKMHADDAVMLNSKGHATELTTSNFFMVKDGTIFTPSVDCGILEGLTRSLILDIAQTNHLKLKETCISKQEMLDADEWFLSSSLRRILPITKCDGRDIGNGKVGPVTQKLIPLFNDAIIECIKKEYQLSDFQYSF